MSKAVKTGFILIAVLLMAMALVSCGKSASADGIIDVGRGNTPGKTNENILAPVNNAPANDGENPVVYTATFFTNGGTAVSPVQGLSVPQAPVTAFSGYVFAGWFLDADFSGNVVAFPYALTKDTYFYAKWVVSGIKEIRTVNDLKSVSNAMSSSYILMTDLNLAGVEWIPLGMKLKPSDKEDSDDVKLDGAIVPFTGTFDGNGHTVYNLSLIPEGEEQEFNYLPYGLFSILGSGATVSNLSLSTFRILLDGGFSDFYIGSLAGQMKGGVVRNCRVNGTVNNPKLQYEEGIWDDFFGSYAEPTENSFIGGLIGGILNGTVDNCSSEGTIVSETVADGVFVGGLSGFNWEGTVRNSFSAMNVKGRYAGGLLGYNNNNVSDSYATGIITGSLSYPAIAGGLVGYNDINGVIEQCYSIGAVSARTAGGLVGVNMFNYSKNGPLNIAGDPVIQAIGTTGEDIDSGKGGIIRNCYSTGNVTANEYGGGLIGRAESNMPVKGKKDIKAIVTDDYYFISHCFAFGNVTAVAQEIAYENDQGVTVITKGVYHSVYAGGLIGHASELRIRSCLSFGNVKAESKRPVVTGDSFVYNSVYADNVIGQNTALVDLTKNTYNLMSSRDVYGSVRQAVTRNGTAYSGFNTAVALPFSGNNDKNVNNVAYLTGRQEFGAGLGFSTVIWNFNNIKIEEGRLPSLR